MTSPYNLSNYKLLTDAVYKSVSKGIDSEQSSSNASAIEYYEQGLKDIQLALSLKLSLKDRASVKEQDLKLHSTRANIQERIHALSLPTRSFKSVESQKRTVELRKPSNPSTPIITKKTKSVTDSKKNVKNEDDKMAQDILDSVLMESPSVLWTDIIGLESAKQALREIVVYPSLRPELFTGLRAPAKGVLLFGPPGTGKTMIAKAVATESKATFFPISASTLTSKFFGQGEKIVKTLFQMARQLQPSVIFIDEVDSILNSRKSDNEHEASRRIKTEFLLQFDGIGTNTQDRLLVLGATNRPFELDDAALRRFVKRIYIPLPEPQARLLLLTHLLSSHSHSLSKKDLDWIVKETEGYSSSDITALAREASLGPLRDLGSKLISVSIKNIRSISLLDFKEAIKVIRKSVSMTVLEQVQEFNREFGCVGT